MKKRLVQAGLMFGSLLILGLTANAQVQYRAEIPFDFQAAGTVFTAGGYSVGKINELGPTLVIRARETGKAKLIGLAMPSGLSRDRSGKLIFVKADGRYTLSEIVTPSFAMKFKEAKARVRMAGGSAPKPETVAVNLH